MGLRENEGRNVRGARDGYCCDGLNSEAQTVYQLSASQVVGER